MRDDATDLRFFLVLTKAGSLAEAARRMDVTPSAVSQRLRQLEARLGLHLVRRSTRRFSLTAEGEIFYAGAIDLLARMDEFVDDLRFRAGQVTGALDVCGPLGFGRRYLGPLLAKFQAQYPGVQVSLTLSDVVPAANPQRFDLIVHIGHLADSSLIAYPIAPNRRLLCASPEYLRHRPALLHPQDLEAHACLVLRENQEDVSLWRFCRKKEEVAVRVWPVMSSNDGDVVKGWALMGLGVLLRSEWDVAEHMDAGRLVQVMPDWTTPDADVVALVENRDQVPARVRLFLTFLQQQFRPQPPWRIAAATN